MVKKALEVWEDECRSLKERMPKVCAKCLHQGESGWCHIHEDIPPPDFADTDNACPDWKDVVPF